MATWQLRHYHKLSQQFKTGQTPQLWTPFEEREIRRMFFGTVHVLLSNVLKLWTALLIVPAENCLIRSSATYFRNCFGVGTYVGYVTGHTWYLHSFQISESLGDHCSFSFYSSHRGNVEIRAMCAYASCWICRSVWSQHTVVGCTLQWTSEAEIT